MEFKIQPVQSVASFTQFGRYAKTKESTNTDLLFSACVIQPRASTILLLIKSPKPVAE
jgi:hypothetical protein